MTSQFEFLREEFESVFEHCERAEAHARLDPRTSAWSGRLALETALKHFFRISGGLPQPGVRSTTGELLREPAFRQLERGRPYKLAWRVHDVGNRGSHDALRPPSPSEALDAIEALFEFMKWFAVETSRTGVVVPIHTRFDRSLLREFGSPSTTKVTVADITNGSSVPRADLLRILILDGVEPPRDPLDDTQVAQLQKYLDIAELFPHIKPFAEMDPTGQRLFEAVAQSMPEDVWWLENGALVTSRLEEVLSESLRSAWNTHERFRFRWLLSHGDLDEVLNTVQALGPDNDPLILSVARAWRSAYEGHSHSDWLMLASIDAQIPRRLASLLAVRGDTVALADIPDELLTPASDALGIEASFDVKCSRLLRSKVPSTAELWSFIYAWMMLQAHSSNARFILLARPLLGRVREHLRDRLWQIQNPDAEEVWGDVAALIREFAPGDELAALAAGLAGEALILAGTDGVWPDEWSREVRRQFAITRGISFIDDDSMRAVAVKASTALGQTSRVTALDFIGNRYTRSVIADRVGTLDLHRNGFHQVMAGALIAEHLHELAEATALIGDKLRQLVGWGDAEDV